MSNVNVTPDDDASTTTDFIPFEPGMGRHATLTAVAAAEEQHERPVASAEILEAADDRNILDDYAETSIRRRLSTLYYQGFLDRQETEIDGARFAYSVSDDGQAELDEHGHYEADR